MCFDLLWSQVLVRSFDSFRWTVETVIWHKHCIGWKSFLLISTFSPWERIQKDFTNTNAYCTQCCTLVFCELCSLHLKNTNKQTNRTDTKLYKLVLKRLAPVPNHLPVPQNLNSIPVFQVHVSILLHVMAVLKENLNFGVFSPKATTLLLQLHCEG